MRLFLSQICQFHLNTDNGLWTHICGVCIFVLLLRTCKPLKSSVKGPITAEMVPRDYETFEPKRYYSMPRDYSYEGYGVEEMAPADYTYIEEEPKRKVVAYDDKMYEEIVKAAMIADDYYPDIPTEGNLPRSLGYVQNDNKAADIDVVKTLFEYLLDVYDT